jgi:predicted extracellular nuclease
MKSLSKLFLLVILFTSGSALAQNNIKIGFYNVENLFDTVDNPLTADEEFTPAGKKAYTTERYNDKLTKLSRAINNTRLFEADIIGLCEVENIGVMTDLIKHELLTSNHYKMVHYDSPDGRGIDCGLIYKSSTIKILKSDSNQFQMHFAERPNTRNQLYVLAYHKKRKQKIHVFINHWPSRYGGEEKSRPKRALAALELKKFIAEKTGGNDYPVVILGDLNDHPDNESVINILGADTLLTNNQKTLFNTSYAWQKQGLGTHNYKGEWGVLDQIIITKRMANKLDVFSQYYAEIIDNAFLLYTNKKGGTSPSRSYGGPNYYGGYSDHLPVMITLTYK